MDVQSGIVLAVIIGAVLLVDRLGDTDELARRLFQVALGAAFAYFVYSGTTAFIRQSGGASPSDFLTSVSSNDGANGARDFANRLVAARAADFSLGVLGVLFGIGGLRRWRTVPLGLAIGGLLLLLASGTGSSGASYQLILLADTSMRASRDTNVVVFAVLGIGFAGLLWFGFTTYERDVGDEASEEDEDASLA